MKELLKNWSKRKKIVVGVVLVIITAVLVGIYWFIYQNTGFLSARVPADELSVNNTNSDLDYTDDYSELMPHVLDVDPSFEESTQDLQRRVLNMPQGFQISVYAADLGKARAFDFDEEDNLYLTDQSGRVLVLVDSDKNGVVETIHEVESGLLNPHGIDWHEGDLYVGAESEIVVYRDITSKGTYSEKKVLIRDLPAGGHVTRTVKVGPDDRLYVAVGSSCNVCEEEVETRAALSVYKSDGEFIKVYSKGIRNTVDFIFYENPESGNTEIWGVNNGRDLIGDDIPQEELNILQEDKHYGWPYCYGEQIANPEYPSREEFCKTTELPKYLMQAHSAPLGLDFMKAGLTESNSVFPTDLERDVFIGFHGSWNRRIPTGYKVVRINTVSNSGEVIDFITGWLEEDGTSWGRPVDVGFDNKNTLYIADDKAGVVYRVVETSE